MQLAAFLFDALERLGIREIFGLPGDFALPIYEALQADGRFTLVRFGHEPAVGFAADGAARMTGRPAVCCVTYGAGGLNMTNAIACAYAEQSPLIVISGGPGRNERRAGRPVHHQVKSFESQLRVYAEVTAYAAILDDPETAGGHILRALDTAVKLKRPVYLEVPRDMVQSEIQRPAAAATVEMETDEGAVAEAVAEIAQRLRAAIRPVLIVGVEVRRFKLQDAVIALAERLRVPVASSFLGRGVFPTRHPQFAGTYLGVVSPPELRQIVETSDCALLLGELISDTSLGVSADALDERNLIICVSRDVFAGHHRYQRTPLDRIVAGLLATAEVPRAAALAFPVAPSQHLAVEPPTERASHAITVPDVIDTLNDFFDARPDVPLVADTGDALFASVDIRSNEIVAPAYYATMGFAVPAALGVEVATGRRPLVLVGDGAFQMTGPEIAHAAGFGCRPVIVLLNNSRWEMLQAFFPHARYNDTPAWPYAKLAQLWGGYGIEVRTPDAFARALDAAWAAPTFSIIEVRLERGDISPVLQRFVAAFKKRVYVT
jgi:indolepyruvate decarboxylase